jgi:hypothetical protein
MYVNIQGMQVAPLLSSKGKGGTPPYIYIYMCIYICIHMYIYMSIFKGCRWHPFYLQKVKVAHHPLKKVVVTPSCSRKPIRYAGGTPPIYLQKVKGAHHPLKKVMVTPSCSRKPIKLLRACNKSLRERIKSLPLSIQLVRVPYQSLNPEGNLSNHRGN